MRWRGGLRCSHSPNQTRSVYVTRARAGLPDGSVKRPWPTRYPVLRCPVDAGCRNVNDHRPCLCGHILSEEFPFRMPSVEGPVVDLARGRNQRASEGRLDIEGVGSEITQHEAGRRAGGVIVDPTKNDVLVHDNSNGGRILRISSGFVTAARIFMRPWYFGHVSASVINTRFRRRAQCCRLTLRSLVMSISRDSPVTALSALAAFGTGDAGSVGTTLARALAVGPRMAAWQGSDTGVQGRRDRWRPCLPVLSEAW